MHISHGRRKEKKEWADQFDQLKKLICLSFHFLGKSSISILNACIEFSGVHNIKLYNRNARRVNLGSV